MRDIAAGIEAAGHVSSRDIKAAASCAPSRNPSRRAREAREMDDWRRFANAQRQEQLMRWPKPSSHR